MDEGKYKPEEIMAKTDWEREVVSKQRREVVSKLVHQHTQKIACGEYGIPEIFSQANELLDSSANFTTQNAFIRFLGIHFLSTSLTGIVKELQNSQKTEETLREEDRLNTILSKDIKLTADKTKKEVEKLAFTRFAQGLSRRDLTALLREKIQNKELPSEKEIIAAFKEKNFSELTKTLYAYWEVNKHKLS